MAIKWGSTTCTVIKWGNTQCSVVYWGSTIVFPGYNGKVLYNGSTFTSPLTKVYVGASTTAITSGAISVTQTANSYATISSNVFKTHTTMYPTDGGINLSSYSYLTIEYTTTNSSMMDFDNSLLMSKNLSSGTYYAPKYDKVANSFITYNISECTFKSACGIKSCSYTCQKGSGSYTITIKKIIGS